MSINAEFVAVASSDLAALVEDPSPVESLFMPGASSRSKLSLDKAWHGVHYLLTGDPESTAGLGAVMLGGTEIGEDEGYGPARFFTVTEVAELAAALASPRVDDDAAARYDARAMTALSVYPGGWDDEARRWLLESLDRLRSFFRDAAASGDAIVTCLV